MKINLFVDILSSDILSGDLTRMEEIIDENSQYDGISIRLTPYNVSAVCDFLKRYPRIKNLDFSCSEFSNPEKDLAPLCEYLKTARVEILIFSKTDLQRATADIFHALWDNKTLKTFIMSDFDNLYPDGTWLLLEKNKVLQYVEINNVVFRNNGEDSTFEEIERDQEAWIRHRKIKALRKEAALRKENDSFLRSRSLEKSDMDLLRKPDAYKSVNSSSVIEVSNVHDSDVPALVDPSTPVLDPSVCAVEPSVYEGAECWVSEVSEEEAPQTGEGYLSRLARFVGF